jgi:hypothetical protein
MDINNLCDPKLRKKKKTYLVIIKNKIKNIDIYFKSLWT